MSALSQKRERDLKIMKSLILICGIACILSVGATSTYACFCVTPEVPEAFRGARAVFIGEVTEIVPPRSDNPKAPLGDQLYAIKFKIEKAWKGVRSQEIVVLSDQGRAGCLSWGPFVKGKKYLVYGERRIATGAHTKNLAVLFSCNRTALLADASEDLKILENVKLRLTKAVLSPDALRYRCMKEPRARLTYAWAGVN